MDVLAYSPCHETIRGVPFLSPLTLERHDENPKNLFELRAGALCSVPGLIWFDFPPQITVIKDATT